MIGPRATHRRGYTLIELLITIAIIALMASMVLFALFSAQESAKVAKTKSLIAKLDSIIKAKWDSYRMRRVPLNFTVTGPSAITPAQAAKARLDALHELMRMEMPDRWTDVWENPITMNGFTLQRPALSQAYLNAYNAVANRTSPPPPSATTLVKNQYAECLYLIVTTALQEEADGREVFKADSVGDTDGDGLNEFIDAWGHPINFLRWAPGFPSDLQVALSAKVKSFTAGSTTPPPTPSTLVATNDPSRAPLLPNPISSFSQAKGAYVGGAIYMTDTLTGYSATIQGFQVNASDVTFTLPPNAFGGGSPPISAGAIFVLLPPDPLDPLGVYANGANLYPSGTRGVPFALYPLIYSAGADGAYGIVADGTTAIDYSLNGEYPFILDASNLFLGTQLANTVAGDPPSCWLDNIHNHSIGTR